jgi:hypothetical protein
MSSTTMFMFCSTYMFIHSFYGYSTEQYDFYVSDSYHGDAMGAYCSPLVLLHCSLIYISPFTFYRTYCYILNRRKLNCTVVYWYFKKNLKHPARYATLYLGTMYLF